MLLKLKMDEYDLLTVGICSGKDYLLFYVLHWKSGRMKYFYITGTSRGIGKALAEVLLGKKDHCVYGISRGKTINHRNYNHVFLDLNQLNKVRKFTFTDHPDAEKIVLVNNAGILGHVAPVGDLDTEAMIRTFNINLISPAILVNKFMAHYKSHGAQKMIVNTSSGAARHPVASWSSYCMTKAGLEMLLHTILDEQKDKVNPVRAYSIAPGIVDTEMQDEIRAVDPDNFRDLDRFINLKEEGLLASPEEVGRKFADIIENPDNYHGSIVDLIS
jgi:benzil reductase ((S)-benzoin forming)